MINLIKNNSIFYNNLNILLTFVYMQLYYILYKFNIDKNISSLNFGINKQSISKKYIYNCRLRL